MVVLLHGLGETPAIMAPLALALWQAGYDVDNVGYPSTLAPSEELVDTKIRSLLDRYPDAPHVHFVTHSLGGILLHAALQSGRPRNLGRVVMTAPGARGSDVLEVYRHTWWFRILYGPAGYESGTQADGFSQHLPRYVDYPLGVIAGCVPLDPLSLLLAPWPHDGKISVARTGFDNMTDHIVLPTAHDYTSSDPMAIFQALHFLRNGAFLHIFHPRAARISR